MERPDPNKPHLQDGEEAEDQGGGTPRERPQEGEAEERQQSEQGETTGEE